MDGSVQPATPGPGPHTSKELAWIISGNPEKHWEIENKSHYVRDVTFHEDANQAYTGNGPQVMATLRNIATGLTRPDDTNNIKRTTEWIGREPLRALPIIAT